MNRRILEYLCCPLCKEHLDLVETAGTETEISDGCLVCRRCGAKYPIENGIADLLPEENQR